MPTILRAAGFRVYFYSHEPGEPPHVHIDRGGASAKVWLESGVLAGNAGFSAKELGEILRLVQTQRRTLLEVGMTSSARAEAADIRVKSVRIDADELSVTLMDGRRIAVPLAWYPRLAGATAAQRSNWEVAGGGYGLHWPEIDEDLSTEGLLRGARAPLESGAWRPPETA